MNSTFQSQMEELNRNADKAYEDGRQFFSLGQQSYQKLMEQQLDTLKGLLDHSVAQSKLVAEAKDARELMSAQVELNRSLAENMLNAGRQLLQLGNETQEAYRSLLETKSTEWRSTVTEATRQAVA